MQVRPVIGVVGAAASARQAERTTGNEPWVVFTWLWAAAALLHVVADPWGLGPSGSTWPAVADLAVLACATLGLLEPQHRWVRMTLASTVVVSVLVSAPRLGNHWFLMGLISLLLLVSESLRGPNGSWALFSWGGRVTFLIGYGAAAFAKLNRDFIDPAWSCAPGFMEGFASFYRLDGLAGMLPPTVPIAATLAIELCIPVLLISPRTRRVGVLLGLGFHGLLSLDVPRHFYDFSAVLFPLLLLFLDRSSWQRIARRVDGSWSGLAVPAKRLIVGAILSLLSLATAVAATSAPAASAAFGFFLWLPVLVGSIAMAGRATVSPEERWMRLGWRHAVVGLVPLLALANAATPYLELKTGYSFNMYSNLRTEAGASNHLIIRRTARLSEEQIAPIEIVSSPAAPPGLDVYSRNGYALTPRQLRVFLASQPSDSVLTYRRVGRVERTEAATLLADLGGPVPLWERKLLPFRAVDLADRQRCNPPWGPADA